MNANAGSKISPSNGQKTDETTAKDGLPNSQRSLSRGRLCRPYLFGAIVAALLSASYILQDAVITREMQSLAPAAPIESHVKRGSSQPSSGDLADASPEDSHGQLPPDAGIIASEVMYVGGRPLDVAAGELVVKFDAAISSSDRDRMLSRMGSMVLSVDEASKYIRIKVPAGRTLAEFQHDVRSLEGVIAANANVLMTGAANKCNTSSEYYGLQWNLGRFNHTQSCGTMSDDPSSVTVAVLDTGVAYENYGSYVKASDLDSVTIISPYDFINNDSHPNDDHQHGTHIATTILGSGRINGVTPGARLMPIKVLDADNRGSEFALAQGIRWAVDNGARLLNLSLSFPVSYVPSGMLQDAVTYAAGKGALIVGSSGNNGDETLPYPAAFREVLSVGSVRIKRLSDGSLQDERASYSNYGPGLDLVSPGGSMQYDANQDGWPDGILAQSIRKNTPGTTSYFFSSGTSQAAAEVTGIAAWLLAAGASPEQARDILLQTATDLGDPGYDTSYGQGVVSLYNALNAWRTASPTATPKYYANIVPVVYRNGSSVAGVANVRVVAANNVPVANAKIVGRWSGSVKAAVQTTTNSSGVVTLQSPWITEGSAGAVFALEISTIVDPATGRRVRAREFFYMSQGLAALLDGTLSADASQGALIVKKIEAGSTALSSTFDISKLATSYVVKAIGPSLGTPGIGIAFTSNFIPGLADGSLPGQDIALNFGGNVSFGDGTRSSSTIRCFSGGVGLAMSNMGKYSDTNYQLTNLERMGAVGLVTSNLCQIPFDSATIKGASADGSAAELVLNEAPDTFLQSNPSLGETAVGLSLSETTFSANSSDVASMDGVISANSFDEAESSWSAELGMSLTIAELGEEAAALPVDSDPEDP